MATTVHIPGVIETPQTSSNKGNSWWGVEALTNRDGAGWFFKRDVDAKVFGKFYVPFNLAGTPNAGIILRCRANVTSGVFRVSVGAKAVASGEASDASYTSETAQDITVPGTARQVFTITFPTSGNIGESLAAGDKLEFVIFHEGAHANDTVAMELVVEEVLLRVDIS